MDNVSSEDAELRARELFEIARPCFHYAERGTLDGNAFEQSEQGRLLMKAMNRIANTLERKPDDVRQLAEQIVAENIDAWGWGPLDDIEGLAEHDLAVKAVSAGLAAIGRAVR